MKRREFLIGAGAVTASTVLFGNGLSFANAHKDTINFANLAHATTSESAPVVFATPEITPQSLMQAYNALGVDLSNKKVAIKLHSGESVNSYNLKPPFVKDFVQAFDSTLVETNTAYGGTRATTESHMNVIREQGFLDIAKVDIMDSEGEMTIPVLGGEFLKENVIGATFDNYDSYIVLTHFKGHPMGGFGGALKNISIGFASGKSGKGYIHSAGTKTGTLQQIAWINEAGFVQGTEQLADFPKTMAEAAKSIQDHITSQNKKVIYINVVNNISVDCDCSANPAKPDMKDIGILASTDPVALDQACVDLIYAAKDSASLIERIESRQGLAIFEQAEKIGFGSRKYRLQSV